MKTYLFVLLFIFSFDVYAKEWKSLKQYQKETQKAILSPSDWLITDRRQNTLIWQQANRFNLTNNKPKEYQSIKERRDFYIWINHEFNIAGHEVNWQKMAYYVSSKMRLLETFPHCILTPEKVKLYAHEGSEVVFDNAFEKLGALYNSDKILIGEEAIKWDEMMLHLEQFIWVESIYKNIDVRSFKQIRRMTMGKFWYALAVPKKLRFKTDISNPEDRYQYGFNILRPYCVDLLE
jgi:hypothetical protein